LDGWKRRLDSVGSGVKIKSVFLKINNFSNNYFSPAYPTKI
jgi:hypothetical protein